jgi:hypothetical protein
MAQQFTPAVPGSIGFLQRLEPIYSKQINPIVTPAPGIEKGVLKLFGSPTVLSLIGGQLLGNGRFQIGPPPARITPAPGVEKGVLKLFGSVTLLSLIGGQLAGSSGGQPQPVPPPSPPTPTPFFAMPLLNRAPAMPGLDPRLQRFINNLSNMWNSLVRQSILVQTGPEDFTIRIPAGGGVLSFNSRTGNVTLNSSDVTGALGYTPIPAVASGVTPGTYQFPTVTVNSSGLVTSVSTGFPLTIDNTIIGGTASSVLYGKSVTGSPPRVVLAESNIQNLSSGAVRIGPSVNGRGQLQIGYQNTGGTTGQATLAVSTLATTLNTSLILGGGLTVSTGNVSVPTISVSSTLSMNKAPTTVNGSVSGTCTFNEVEIGSARKEVVMYLNALNGTATFNFGTAFSHTPVVITTSGLATALVTSLSTTSVTVTGTTSTGFLFIEGF